MTGSSGGRRSLLRPGEAGGDREPVPILRPLEPGDRNWLSSFLRGRWGGETVVAHGEVFRPAELPGYAFLENGRAIGVVTFLITGGGCEVITLDSLTPRRGLGTRLLEAVRHAAIKAGCEWISLVTTNDNLEALRFYQKRGFVLTALRPDALAAARRLKPEIPPLGQHGIPLRDELELRLPLGEA